MAQHFPFMGRANRVGIFGFFEAHGLGLELQERYYRWWYEWAKMFVARDPDLRAAKGVEFERYPYGQHADHSFHLHGYRWATALLDLGEFIRDSILPKLDGAALQRLEAEHEHMLEQLHAEREQKPRPAPPDIGRYRHT